MLAYPCLIWQLSTLAVASRLRGGAIKPLKGDTAGPSSLVLVVHIFAAPFLTGIRSLSLFHVLRLLNPRSLLITLSLS